MSRRPLLIAAAVLLIATACGEQGGTGFAQPTGEPTGGPVEQAVLPACDDLEDELPVDGPLSDDPEVAAIQQARADSGLPSDEATVERIIAETGGEDGPFGFPHTAEEFDEVLAERGADHPCAEVEGVPQAEDAQVADWEPDGEVDRAATRIPVHVMERGCAGGVPATGASPSPTSSTSRTPSSSPSGSSPRAVSRPARATRPPPTCWSCPSRPATAGCSTAAPSRPRRRSSTPRSVARHRSRRSLGRP